MKKGKKYELETTNMLKLAHPLSTVIHDAKIIGLLTGVKRQVDVKVDLSQYDFIAYECKDWKATIDIPVVEGFIQKLEDLGAKRGAIISNSEFSKGAITLASKKNVKLLHVIDAENPDIYIKISAPTLVEIKNIDTYSLAIESNITLSFPPIKDIANLSIMNRGREIKAKDYLRSEWRRKLSRTSSLGENKISIENVQVIGYDGEPYIVPLLEIRYNVKKDYWLGETGIEAARGLYDVHTKIFQGFGNLKSESLKISDIPTKFKQITKSEAEAAKTTVIIQMAAA